MLRSRPVRPRAVKSSRDSPDCLQRFMQPTHIDSPSGVPFMHPGISQSGIPSTGWLLG